MASSPTPNAISIFVTVGTNQYDFSRMFKLVEKCIKAIDRPYNLTIQYGYSDKDKIPFLESENIKIVNILTREQAELQCKTADIIFSHAGVGSVFNSLKYNRPTVLVPRLSVHSEFSDDHQLQIANELQTNELIHLIETEFDQDAFVAFFNRSISKEKVEMDLVNNDLADFIREKLVLNTTHGKILVVASAGGHITEAVCAVSRLDSYSLVTTLTPLLNAKATTVYIVNRSQFNPLKYAWSTIRALLIIKKEKPDSIFSTGGPICLPYALLSKVLGIKFVYLDTLSRVTELSNTAVFLKRFRLTKHIYCQWQIVQERYPSVINCGKVFKID